MANFSDVLNRPAASIERPKPLPVGTYHCIVDGPGEQAEVGQKKTEAIIFKLRPLSAGPDVDAGALAEAGGVVGKTIRHTMYITSDAAWRLKQFLVDHLGIEAGSKTLGELVSEAPGRQVSVAIKHRAAQDGSAIYAEVASTAKI